MTPSRAIAIPSVDSALEAAGRRLSEAGLEGPRREARLLMSHALRCGVGEVLGYPERGLKPEEAERFEALVAARAARMPLSRIVGCREFWSLSFEVTPETLDPRPESETLIAALLERLLDHHRAYRVLDLGTGTGCLLLALLSELRNATGVGIERSPGAAATARRNAARLGLAERAHIVVSDWTAALDATFDVVVCNPPYVPSGEIGALAPEVSSWDPRAALDGGEDGLDAYRNLAPRLGPLLSAEGIAALEIGAGQASEVGRVFRTAGLPTRGSVCDLAGIERCILLGR